MKVTHPGEVRPQVKFVGLGTATNKNHVSELKHPIKEMFYMGEAERDCIHIELICESPIWSQTYDQVFHLYPKVFLHTDGRHFVFVGTHSERKVVIYQELRLNEPLFYTGATDWKSV